MTMARARSSQDTCQMIRWQGKRCACPTIKAARRRNFLCFLILREAGQVRSAGRRREETTARIGGLGEAVAALLMRFQAPPSRLSGQIALPDEFLPRPVHFDIARSFTGLSTARSRLQSKSWLWNFVIILF